MVATDGCSPDRHYVQNESKGRLIFVQGACGHPSMPRASLRMAQEGNATVTGHSACAGARCAVESMERDDEGRNHQRPSAESAVVTSSHCRPSQEWLPQGDEHRPTAHLSTSAGAGLGVAVREHDAPAAGVERLDEDCVAATALVGEIAVPNHRSANTTRGGDVVAHGRERIVHADEADQRLAPADCLVIWLIPRILSQISPVLG